MGKSQSQSRVFSTVLFVILAAVSLYYLYLGYDFIKSVSVNAGRSGFAFYKKFPTVLAGGALQYILGTALFIFFAVKYFGYAFKEKQQKAGFMTLMSAGLLIIVAVSEVLSYYSYTVLLGKGYKVLLHLKSLINFSGIARVVVLLFVVFIFAASIVLMAKQRHASGE